MGTLAKNKKVIHKEEKMVNHEAKEFGQRFSQIKEKSGLTIKEITGKSGLSKAIIEATLKGLRHPKKTETQLLAKAFDISPEQLKGDDTKVIKKYLDTNIRKNNNYDLIAASIAKLQDKSICLNDDLDIMFYQGQYYRTVGQLEKAHLIIKNAFLTATENLLTEDPRYIRACNEVLFFYYNTGQYEMVRNFVGEVNAEGLFVGRPDQQAVLLNYLGFSSLVSGEHETARNQLSEAATLYIIAGKLDEAGRCKANVGTNLYLHDYAEESLGHFEKAIVLQENDLPYNKCVTNKEYARALFAIGRIEDALGIIDKTLALIDRDGLNFSELKAKLLLMKGDNKDDTTSLEQAIREEINTLHLKANIHEVLAEKYMLKKNFEKACFHHERCIAILKRCLDYDDYRKGEWM